MSDFERFHVITGGPGSGKSTLIEALGRRGYAHSIEAGRAIIQDQIAIDGPALPDRDPLAFAELMLSWELRSHRMAQAETGPVFFDRGVPDMVGYFHLLGRPVPSHVTRAAERFRYNRRAFLAPRLRTRGPAACIGRGARALRARHDRRIEKARPRERAFFRERGPPGRS